MAEPEGFKRLFEMHQGIFYTRLLHEAISLKVFDYLLLASTSDEIANALNTNGESTKHFLRGLAAAGLVAVRGKFFYNTQLSQTFLVTTSDSYLGDYLTNHAKWNQPLFNDFYSFLKSGRPHRTNQADHEEIWANEAKALVNFQRVCTGPVLAEVISQTAGIKKNGRMLDLGGGPGGNAQAVLEVMPGMTGTLFDRKAVIEIAEKEICKTKGMKNRLFTLTGDFTKDDFGNGWDLIIATSCLNFVKNDMRAFAVKIFEALAPEGIFISIHDGMNHNKTQPSSIALSWLPVSMMWEDLSLEKGKIPEALECAGFKSIRSKPLNYGLGSMELDIARKT